MNVNVTIASPELAEALNNLAEAIRGRTGAFVPVTAAETVPVEETSSGKPARSAKAKPTTPPTSEPETATGDGDPRTANIEERAPASSSNDESSDAEGVDYADIKKAVVALSLAKGRDQVVAILTKFGVPEGGKADQVAEERWGELLLALTEAAK